MGTVNWLNRGNSHLSFLLLLFVCSFCAPLFCLLSGHELAHCEPQSFHGAVKYCNLLSFWVAITLPSAIPPHPLILLSLYCMTAGSNQYQCLSFSFWFITLKKMSCSFIHLPQNLIYYTSLIFPCAYIFSAYPLKAIGCLSILGVVSNVAIDIRIQVSFDKLILITLYI